MSKKHDHGAKLSRRERQIMDIVYAAGEASASDVLEALPDPPSYSTVRKLLSILAQKGHVQHRAQNGRYLYRSTEKRATAGRSALNRVLQTFYDGSIEKAVASLLQGRSAKISDAELARLSQLIEDSRKEGR